MSRKKKVTKEIMEKTTKKYKYLTQNDITAITMARRASMNPIQRVIYDYGNQKLEENVNDNKKKTYYIRFRGRNIFHWATETRGAASFFAYMLSLFVYYFMSYLTLHMITYTNDVITDLPDQAIFVWRFLPFVMLIVMLMHINSASGFWYRVKAYSMIYVYLSVYTAIYPIAGKILYVSGVPEGVFNLVMTLLSYMFLAFIAAPFIGVMRKML